MPFSGRLNGVPPWALASALASKGVVVPLTAVSWIVIHSVLNARPYVWRSRTSSDRMAVSAVSLVLNTMLPRCLFDLTPSTWSLPPPLFRSDLSYGTRSEEHTSELQSLRHLVCRLLLE